MRWPTGAMQTLENSRTGQDTIRAEEGHDQVGALHLAQVLGVGARPISRTSRYGVPSMTAMPSNSAMVNR